MNYQEHSDSDVQAALIRLCDVLCTWERSTGRESLLIIREVGGYHFRADCGKPLDSALDDMTDEQLMRGLRHRAEAAGQSL